MLGVEAVPERMADHVVGHHPTMPGGGKTAQAVAATRRLENSSHASIMTIVSGLCKTIANHRCLYHRLARFYVASQRNPMFMLGGAPEAQEVLSKTPRIEIPPLPNRLPRGFSDQG